MPNHTTNKVFLCCIQARCTTGKQLDVEEDFYTNVFALAYEYECHTHTYICITTRAKRLMLLDM